MGLNCLTLSHILCRDLRPVVLAVSDDTFWFASLREWDAVHIKVNVKMIETYPNFQIFKKSHNFFWIEYVHIFALLISKFEERFPTQIQ